MKRLMTLAVLAAAACSQQQYGNPVLYLDYSDPDVVAADGGYWLTSSSFNCTPGLQILHSDNLVDWEIAGSALPGGPETYWDEAAGRPIEMTGPERSPDAGVFPRRPTGAPVEHGNGVWAPSIRCHDGMFWIFWGDPDYGIYQVHAEDPRGEWSKPVCVIAGKGFIDPCPLWDDDGRVWLVHAWANSRCGIKSVLHLCELNSDCTACISEQTMVFDGRENGNVTVEGPKFYKKDGWYWIFAPAGGVKPGWQLAMRSRDVYGPYEWKTVLHQGETDICGPHQGGWVTDSRGRDWFMHFEDRYAWGRVVHLQPMSWTEDGWPVIGCDTDGDGIGEPVAAWKAPERLHKDKPVCNEYQWQASPGSYASDGSTSLWNANLKLRKIEGPDCCELLGLHLPLEEGLRRGIVVMGSDYATIHAESDGAGSRICVSVCRKADKGGTEEIVYSAPLPEGCAYVLLKVEVEEGEERGESSSDIPAECHFSWNAEADGWHDCGVEFRARAGRWIGAKIGCF